MLASAAAVSARALMQIACASPQARTGARTVTVSVPDGVTVSSHVPADCPGACRALVMLPPVTSSALAASRFGDSPSGAPLNCSSILKALAPSWLSGTLRKLALGPVLRTVDPSTATPLCSRIASASVAVLRMVPPLSVTLFGGTEMEACVPSPAASV